MTPGDLACDELHDRIGKLPWAVERDVVSSIELDETTVRHRLYHSLRDVSRQHVRARATHDQGGTTDRAQRIPQVAAARAAHDRRQRLAARAPREAAVLVAEQPAQ